MNGNGVGVSLLVQMSCCDDKEDVRSARPACVQLHHSKPRAFLGCIHDWPPRRGK